MKRRFFRRHSNRSGAAMVEFAMLTPILMTLLSAVLDYGELYHWQSMHQVILQQSTRNVINTRDDDSATLLSELELVTTDWLNNSGLAYPNGMPICNSSTSCTVTSSLITLTDASASYFVAQVEVSRPFEPTIGLVPAPGSITQSFAMRVQADWATF